MQCIEVQPVQRWDGAMSLVREQEKCLLGMLFPDCISIVALVVIQRAPHSRLDGQSDSDAPCGRCGYQARDKATQRLS